MLVVMNFELFQLWQKAFLIYARNDNFDCIFSLSVPRFDLLLYCSFQDCLIPTMFVCFKDEFTILAFKTLFPILFWDNQFLHLMQMKRSPWGAESENVLTRRRADRSRTLHLKRICEIKPQIDCTAPSTYLKVNDSWSWKQQQRKKNRLKEIERENEKLHEKINAIFRKKPQQKGPSKSEHLTKTSLNVLARTKEQQRIQKENRILMQRIKE